MIDVFYGQDITGGSYSFLNATSFQVVSCLGTLPPAAKDVLHHFLTTLSTWAGLPRSIQLDFGKEFMTD